VSAELLATTMPKGLARLLGLIALYGLSFSVPILGLWFLLRSGDAVYTDQISKEKSALIEKSFSIHGAGDYLRISNSEDIQPQPNKDFMFLLWFKLHKIPKQGERVFLALKYDKDSNARQGYGLALEHDSEGLRPLVYWQNSEGQGRWYSFSPFTAIPKEWMLLSVSFLDSKILGLHVIEYLGEKPKVKVLGGYRFDSAVIPQSASDLFIGGLSNGDPLKAKLGGFGIFHPKQLAADLNSIFEELELAPLVAPAKLKGSGIWIQDLSDLGDYSKSISFYKDRKLVENPFN